MLWVLKHDGYIFSFFWLLDLASIFSLFFDIDWIANPLGFTAINSGSGDGKYAKGSQVVRLVRLTRLVRLYRIYTMKRRRQLLKKKIMETAASEGLDVENELKKVDLYAQRDSKLGILLNDSTTKKLILLILSILFILPLLTAQNENKSPKLLVNLLQHYNTGDYTLAQKQDVIDLAIKRFEYIPKSQYFDTTLVPYLVYLQVTPSFSDPLIYAPESFANARSGAIATVDSKGTPGEAVWIGNTYYEVVAKFDNSRLNRDRYHYSINIIYTI